MTRLSPKKAVSMDMDNAAAVAHCLMSQHGLEAKGWRFDFDNAAARAGLCDQHQKKITVSRELTERNGRSFFIDTVLHEIAHALAGAHHHHDAVWRRTVRSIGGTAGRTHDAHLAYRFIGTCARCGAHSLAMRKRLCSCSSCYPKFNRKAIIT